MAPPAQGRKVAEFRALDSVAGNCGLRRAKLDGRQTADDNFRRYPNWSRFGARPKVAESSRLTPHASRARARARLHDCTIARLHEHDWRSKSCTLETGKMGLENTINRYAGSMQRAGLPTHLERAGMLRINVEPAPTIAHAPISMPGMTEQPIPNMAPAPTRTLPAMCVPGAI